MDSGLAEKIDRQVAGLNYAFIELMLAAQESGGDEFDPVRVEYLLDLIPRHCPYPASMIEQVVDQFNEHREAALTDTYNTSRMEPDPPAYLSRLGLDMKALLFVAVAAINPIEDNDLFRQVRAERLIHQALEGSEHLTRDQRRMQRFEGLLQRIEREMNSKRQTPLEFSDQIDRQMTGLMHAMVELALASHPNDEGVYNLARIQRLLDAMPMKCPYPCSTVPALVRQFTFDRHITLRDVYDAVGMRPKPPAYLRELDDEMLAEVFIGVAAHGAVADNEIFMEERAEMAKHADE